MSTTLGGVTLLSQGWQVQRTTGIDDLSARRVPIIEVPSLGESIEGSRQPILAPGEITVAVFTRDASLSTVRSRLAWLEHAVGGKDPVRLEHVRRPNQERYVRCVSGPAGWGPGAGAVGPYAVQGVLRFTATQPWQDTADQTVAFGSSATAIPLGPKPCRGIITITAPSSNAVNPTILYKSSGGTTLATLTLAHTILVGDAWEANCWTGAIRKRVSGVWSNAITTLAPGFTLPILDPYDGVFASSSWPTIQTSTGSGSVVYRRRY